MMMKAVKKLLGDLQYAIAFRDIAMVTHLTPQEKREILGKYATTHQNFVETGTYLGETTAAMAKLYKKVYTIEIQQSFYEKAQSRFATLEHILCFHGDSGTLLPRIVDELEGPTVFWLDGHYSGPRTGKSHFYDTPIIQELKTIFRRQAREDVILIDDARCFCGRHSYPRIGKLVEFIRKNSEFFVTIKDDIVRLQYDSEWS